MGEIIVSIRDASKSFNGHKVLNDISLQINAGTILGLIGPSGAGKTTAIKCILGMERIDEGISEIFGVKMPNRGILQKLGYMGQSVSLYENLTAVENLEFFGRLMGLSGDGLRKAIDDNIRLVALEDYGKRIVNTFSGGMKRRLSLAITLLSNPDLIILDEPTVGIDPKLRLEIWNRLRGLADESKGIIVTTHVMDEAEKCDVVALIIDGRIFAMDSPSNLKKQFDANSIEEVFLKAEVSEND